MKLGRPEGTGLETAELLEKHKDVVKLLKAGQSVSNTAKIAGKGCQHGAMGKGGAGCLVW